MALCSTDIAASRCCRFATWSTNCQVSASTSSRKPNARMAASCPWSEPKALTKAEFAFQILAYFGSPGCARRLPPMRCKASRAVWRACGLAQGSSAASAAETSDAVPAAAASAEPAPSPSSPPPADPGTPADPLYARSGTAALPQPAPLACNSCCCCESTATVLMTAETQTNASTTGESHRRNADLSRPSAPPTMGSAPAAARIRKRAPGIGGAWPP
mmetsp:Transcript_30719/g.77674  ORF Transcript_30719/g.77674 Transcript_30719/m.77674 type:complete len:217 (+) Transcript_30719:96-746(+)